MPTLPVPYVIYLYDSGGNLVDEMSGQVDVGSSPSYAPNTLEFQVNGNTHFIKIIIGATAEENMVPENMPQGFLGMTYLHVESSN